MIVWFIWRLFLVSSFSFRRIFRGCLLINISQQILSSFSVIKVRLGKRLNRKCFSAGIHILTIAMFQQKRVWWLRLRGKKWLWSQHNLVAFIGSPHPQECRYLMATQSENFFWVRSIPINILRAVQVAFLNFFHRFLTPLGLDAQFTPHETWYHC